MMSEIYRFGVGLVLLNSHDKIFAGMRCHISPPAWQMPQGGIDEGETPLEALYREMHEEIGLLPHMIHMVKETHGWHSYDFPPSLAPHLWEGQYKGQKQKWFLARFLGKDTDIILETKHPEFEDWRWTEPHFILEHTISFKKNHYQNILNYFSLL